MTVKLKEEDVARAVKEYIEKLFGNVTVKGTTYHKKTKAENGVIVEAEIETNTNKGA